MKVRTVAPENPRRGAIRACPHRIVHRDRDPGVPRRHGPPERSPELRVRGQGRQVQGERGVRPHRQRGGQVQDRRQRRDVKGVPGAQGEGQPGGGLDLIRRPEDQRISLHGDRHIPARRDGLKHPEGHGRGTAGVRRRAAGQQALRVVDAPVPGGVPHVEGVGDPLRPADQPLRADRLQARRARVRIHRGQEGRVEAQVELHARQRPPLAAVDQDIHNDRIPGAGVAQRIPPGPVDQRDLPGGHLQPDRRARALGHPLPCPEEGYKRIQ